MIPERDLISAVLFQAVQDVMRPIWGTRGTDRDSARAFCLDRHGAWAESRETLCWSIDVDPEAFRQHVAQLIADHDRGQKTKNSTLIKVPIRRNPVVEVRV